MDAQRHAQVKNCRWESSHGPVRTYSPHFGLMAILNLTPDSFYDGGEIKTGRALLDKVADLIDAGADIIDLGAESTRPGSQAMDPELEAERLAPALRCIKKNYPEVQISVDTRKSFVAVKSLELGASIINDISGLQYDPGLLEIIAAYRPAYVLTHSRGLPEFMQLDPKYDNILDELCLFFEMSLEKLRKAGLPESHVLLDPGIGFGKSLAHNLEILRNLERFSIFGRPLLIGLSMKSVFGELLGHKLNERSCDTAVASALCWNKGIFWHRVHEIKKVRDALRCALAFRNALPD